MPCPARARAFSEKKYVQPLKPNYHGYQKHLTEQAPQRLPLRYGAEDAVARWSVERAAAQRWREAALRGPGGQVPARGHGLQADAQELQDGPDTDARRRARQVRRLPAARLEVDEAYAKLIAYLNALLLISPTEELTQLEKVLNADIKLLETQLAAGKKKGTSSGSSGSSGNNGSNDGGTTVNHNEDTIEGLE